MNKSRDLFHERAVERAVKAYSLNQIPVPDADRAVLESKSTEFLEELAYYWELKANPITGKRQLIGYLDDLSGFVQTSQVSDRAAAIRRAEAQYHGRGG